VETGPIGDVLTRCPVRDFLELRAHLVFLVFTVWRTYCIVFWISGFRLWLIPIIRHMHILRGISAWRAPRLRWYRGIRVRTSTYLCIGTQLLAAKIFFIGIFAVKFFTTIPRVFILRAVVPRNDWNIVLMVLTFIFHVLNHR